jgi:hypothetical protein
MARPLGLKRFGAWERKVAQAMEVEALGLRCLSKARGKAESNRAKPLAQSATVRAVDHIPPELCRKRVRVRREPYQRSWAT